MIKAKYICGCGAKAATPGPWEMVAIRNTRDEPRYYDIFGPTPAGLSDTRSYVIADTLNRYHCIDPEEDEANARLIAAAPDLLAACKLAKKRFDECGMDWLGKSEDPLEAAIKKAEAHT